MSGSCDLVADVMVGLTLNLLVRKYPDMLKRLEQLAVAG